MKPIDYKEGQKVTIWCIIGNIVLSAFKLAAGIFGGSKAMTADALHSVSDIIATGAVYIGIRIAKKPADKGHHYGHGRIEPIAASFVGITLVIAAFMITKNMVISIVSKSFGTPSIIAVIAALVSIIVKETMYRVTYAAGKRINSQAIMADAWHHRSDAFSSIGTLIGICGSIIGNKLKIGFLSYLDPIAGAVVACLIFKVAYDILSHSIKQLMDSAPDEKKLSEIRIAVESIDSIESISWLKARYIGQYLHIDIGIEVNIENTIEYGHSIAESVKAKLIESIEDAFEVIVHVDPFREKCQNETAVISLSEHVNEG